MNALEIIGFKRANLGKADARRLRDDAMVPCVLYGGKEQVTFIAPMIMFRELVYTENVFQVNLDIEGKKYKAVMQDIQFHPVNDMIMHVDFLELNDAKEVKLEVPVHYEGTAPGVIKGGKLITKMSKVKIKALPKNVPDFVTVDISSLDLGKSVRVRDLKVANFKVLNAPAIPLASVEIPRALRGKAEDKK